MKKTFETNYGVEIYESLEFTYRHLKLSKNKSYHWKWARIGIHGGLQICMASALRDDEYLKELQVPPNETKTQGK